MTAPTTSTAATGPYTMKVEKGVTVTMRDGVRISLCIYRPDSEGAFPALFAASPYQYEFDDVPAYPIYPWRETGPVEWYVQRGYAYVHADVRGSGFSEGDYGFLNRSEQEDSYELIEWIARQPWCNGNVGGMGQSYYAMQQWLYAALNPPSLKCIIPYDGLVDQYRCSNYHGGIHCSYRPGWYIMLLAINQHRLVSRQARPRMSADLVGDILEHQLDDEWWKERSAYERLGDIKVPVLSIGHWGKMGLHLRGNIIGYEGVTAPKKLVVTGSRNSYEAHHLFDQIDFHEKEMLPFYERHLKGVDNGIMDEPPVRLFVRNSGYRQEAEWPLKRAQYVPYYLNSEPSGSLTSLNDGSLSTKRPGQDGGSTSYSFPDRQWRNGVVAFDDNGRADPVRRVLTFTTAPLESDIEVTGPIVLKLFASSTLTDARFIVKLAEQHPQDEAARARNEQPASTLVSKGWLRASHREKDETRSTELRPFYTHNNPQPIVPGEVYEFDIEVLPVSYLFRAGHRIRLEIAPGDSQLTDHLQHHPFNPSFLGTDTVHHGGVHASRLMLPVIAG